MAVTLTQIRAGLATNLNALVAASPQLQVSAYMLTNPQPPTIHLYPGGGSGNAIDYDMTLARGLDHWSFTVQAFVPLSSTDTNSQDLLDQFLAPSGTHSLKKALEADKTLGGIVSDVHVVSCTGYRLYVREGGPPVLGADWHVDVLASGT